MTSTSAYAMAIEREMGLDRLEPFAHGLDHPEGIAVAPGGTIYVGGEAGQIYAIEDGGAPREIANTGGFVLGVTLDGEGRLYACDEGVRRVFLIDPASGRVELLTSGLPERPMTLPNWAAFDERGTLYITDSGDWQGANGLIWAMRPGRRLEVFSEQSVDFPNGLAVAPDGSRLFVAESVPGRIVEIPIDDDGTAGRRRVLCELGMVVPDGVTAAADGSLVIACYRPDAIFRWHPDDGLDVLASDPHGIVLSSPTNVAFLGERGDVLVVPNLAGWNLVRGDLGVRGVPLARPTAALLEA